MTLFLNICLSCALSFFAAYMKFKDYLRKLNKMKFGFLAKKASRMILIFIKFENYIRNLAKPKNVFFLQLKSNEGIISCYQEEYKCLMCKIILAVCLYREKKI